MTNDLISREALLEWVKNQKAEATGVYGNIIAASINAVMQHNVVNAICKAPAVDAVEVVRCKDCLHWIDGVCGNFSNEDGSDYFTPAHGYCYAAEKEDDE